MLDALSDPMQCAAVLNPSCPLSLGARVRVHVRTVTCCFGNLLLASAEVRDEAEAAADADGSLFSVIAEVRLP